MSIVTRLNIGSEITFSMKVYHELKPGMVQSISSGSQNGYLNGISQLHAVRDEQIEEIRGSPSDDSTNINGRSGNAQINAINRAGNPSPDMISQDVQNNLSGDEHLINDESSSSFD